MLRTAVCALAVILAMTPIHATPLAADTAAHQTVGLVLSGGGAKGIAHIGVIQALEDNDIPIDYVTGTSMGAIVGGLYACGYTPAEMMQLLLSKQFSYWSTGQIDPDEAFYFTAEAPSPVMLSVPINTTRDSAQNARNAVMASLISPMPMNFAFMELFSPYQAVCGGDFSRLMVPFRCVASDAAAKHKVVLRGGDLGYSIRSSMSFPIVFQPTQIDSMLLYDGGLYDNFPVDVMNDDFAPDFLLGIDVSTVETGPQTSLMDQLDNLVVQNNDYYLDPANGIKIRFDLNQFGLLDFPKAKQIYQIGYEKAMSMMDSIKSRIYARQPAQERELRRAVFKSQAPYVRFDSVNVHGASPRQNQYIEYLFNPSHRPEPISIDKARNAYYRAITPGKLRDLVPHAHYNPATDLYSLDLKASVKDNFKLGFGGYITSSTSSYVYLSAGYSTLSFSSMSANVGAWLGQSYLGGMLTSRIYLRTAVPSALELQGVAFRQKYYAEERRFFDADSPFYILNHEYFGRLKWAWACGSLWAMEAGAGFGHLADSFYQPSAMSDSPVGRDHNKFNLGQAFARLESSTLDDLNFPTSGHYYQATAMGVMGRYHHSRDDAPLHSSDARWLQFEARTRNYFAFGRHFSLGLEADALLSTRKVLADYNATLVCAPAFNPTPSSYNRYNPAFRALSFLAAGIAPIYRYNDNISARVQGYCFLPLRRIEQGPGSSATLSSRWLSHPVWYAEADVCYKLPFASVALYVNYASRPARDWNVGISFGVFLPAPRFLR